MSGPERFGASLAGVVLAGGGATAVFLTENQAGSTALLLVGAVFLLIGVQGTPILRASKDAVELQNRAKEVAEKSEEIAGAQGVAAAENFLSGALSAAPGLSASPLVTSLGGMLYETQVREALERIGERRGLDVSIVSRSAGYDFDLRLIDNTGRTPESAGVAVKVMYRTALEQPLSAVQLDELRNRVGADHPLLVVGNVILDWSGKAVMKENDGKGMAFVRWGSESDDDVLAESVNKLLGLTGP